MKIRSFFLLLKALTLTVCVIFCMDSCSDEREHAHAFAATETVSDSTCESEGIATRTCTVCGLTERLKIEKKQHSEQILPKRAATCDLPGLTEGRICTACGKITVAQERIILPHSYFNGTCSVCGAVASESSAISIDYGDELAPLPYCPSDATLPGYTLTDIDMGRADLAAVYNPADGLYHYMHADGPVLLVKMDLKTAYTDSLTAILSDPSVRKHIYRDGESGLMKISYADMLDKYIAASAVRFGGVGVYPLDEHLMRALCDLGEENGWWGKYASAQTQIFGDGHSVPTERAWMFALCYAELKPASHRITVKDTAGAALIGASVYVCDDEGFVLARAVTDSCGVAELVFMHRPALYVFFEDHHAEDYIISDDGYRLDGGELLIVLSAAVDTGDGESDGYDPEDKYNTYNWKTAQIKMQISEQGTDSELSPVYRRMLAGETMYVAAIDSLVAQRNRTAESAARVKVVYSYVTDADDDYSLGTVGDAITERVFALGSSAPDIFCDSINDLIAASLKGCFYNMKSKSDDNHFSFNELGYDAQKNAHGYSNTLMSSLSLSPTKSFILASDYLTDTVRALNTVPVDLALLESIAVQGELDFLSKDGFADADSFHAAVMSGKWDYSLLIALCDAAYGVGADGIVLNTSSDRAAAALLYSANIKIFDRRVDMQEQKYSCVFEERNEALGGFFSALAELCGGTGVIAAECESSDIRERFTASRLLCGGIVPLAALEDSEYGDVADGGLYIAPVPKLDPDSPYRTVLDGSARLAAINTSSAALYAATAFLDHQSTHSESILDAYCLYGILYGAVGAGQRNKEALELIISSLSVGCESVYDLAVAMYFPADADAVPLSRLLCGADFKIDDSDLLWRTYSVRRSEYLERLVKYYEAIK